MHLGKTKGSLSRDFYQASGGIEGLCRPLVDSVGAKEDSGGYCF